MDWRAYSYGDLHRDNDLDLAVRYFSCYFKGAEKIEKPFLKFKEGSEMIKYILGYGAITICLLLMVVLGTFMISHCIYHFEPDLWKKLTGKYPKR